MTLPWRNVSGRILGKNFMNYAQIPAVKYGRSVDDDPTAGIIVIGDEILKAQVKDTNSNYMCSLLYDRGVKVKKISVVSDEVDRIAEEIVSFADKYTYVVTSGGIGPTHDDVTFEALAKAFDDSLHYHPKLVEVVKSFSSSQNVSSPGYKLAYIPTSASLKFGKNPETGRRPSYPCISVRNVYVFPGSPIFLRESFGNVYKELFASYRSFVTKELYLDAREELFADALSTVAREFPDATFGSYPIVNHSYYQARVTVESNGEQVTDKAAARFMDLAPTNSFVNYDSDPLKDALKKFNAFVSTDRQGPLYEATLTSLRETYGRSTSRVAVCFDGSIETTVLLHLLHLNNLPIESGRIEAVHLIRKKPFAAVEHFIKETVARYDLEFHTLEGSPKEAIQELGIVRPEIGVLLLGSKGDKVEGGPWHELVKLGGVNRIDVRLALNGWTYKNVWNFARSLCLPYCKLYDLGYTSLGDRGETEPNPNLLKIKTPGRTEHNPAYMLDDASLERAGRTDNDRPKTNGV